jgi:hypothetical protein
MADVVVQFKSSDLSWTYKNAYPDSGQTYSDANVGNMAAAVGMQLTSNAEDQLNAQSAAMQETSNRLAQLTDWAEAPTTHSFGGAVGQYLYEAGLLNGAEFSLAFTQRILYSSQGGGSYVDISRTIGVPDQVQPVPADYPSQGSLVNDTVYRREDGSYFYYWNAEGPSKEYDFNWSTASATWSPDAQIADQVPAWQEVVKAKHDDLSQISATQLNLLAATKLGYEQAYGMTSATIDKNQRAKEGILRNLA